MLKYIKTNVAAKTAFSQVFKASRYSSLIPCFSDVFYIFCNTLHFLLTPVMAPSPWTSHIISWLYLLTVLLLSTCLISQNFEPFSLNIMSHSLFQHLLFSPLCLPHLPSQHLQCSLLQNLHCSLLHISLTHSLLPVLLYTSLVLSKIHAHYLTHLSIPSSSLLHSIFSAASVFYFIHTQWNHSYFTGNKCWYYLAKPSYCFHTKLYIYSNQDRTRNNVFRLGKK